MGFPGVDAFLIILGALLILILFGAAVVVFLWIAMPFSVFGIKDLIKKSIEEQEKTNRLLESVLKAVKEKEEQPKPSERPD